MRASEEMLSRCPRFAIGAATRNARIAIVSIRSDYWPLTSDAIV
jgi:hypothetical protein